MAESLNSYWMTSVIEYFLTGSPRAAIAIGRQLMVRGRKGGCLMLLTFNQEMRKNALISYGRY